MYKYLAIFFVLFAVSACSAFSNDRKDDDSKASNKELAYPPTIIKIEN